MIHPCYLLGRHPARRRRLLLVCAEDSGIRVRHGLDFSYVTCGHPTFHELVVYTGSVSHCNDFLKRDLIGAVVWVVHAKRKLSNVDKQRSDPTFETTVSFETSALCHRRGDSSCILSFTYENAVISVHFQHTQCLLGVRDSSVARLLAAGPENWGSFPGRANAFTS